MKLRLFFFCLLTATALAAERFDFVETPSDVDHGPDRPRNASDFEDHLFSGPETFFKWILHLKQNFSDTGLLEGALHRQHYLILRTTNSVNMTYFGYARAAFESETVRNVLRGFANARQGSQLIRLRDLLNQIRLRVTLRCRLSGNHQPQVYEIKVCLDEHFEVKDCSPNERDQCPNRASLM
ncbi:hypothetical protein QR680_010344 [Steinernema hermaphroditum]|uniref:Uncharacterized protein n=1 Tax=Steinernema hermaphroditum TaxID=289476 RepID=A0AA39IQH6_9BILA|nr:hypothetical protein QR680_010344 [Steinernema hermaphroditum]